MKVFRSLPALVLLLSACGGTAAPAPSSSGSPAASALSPAMQQLVDAARKEGTVTWSVTSSCNDCVEPIHQLIKSKWGVDLKVESTANSDYAAAGQKLLSEVQAKAPASYDVVATSDSNISALVTRDALMQVDWAKYVPNLPEAAVVSKSMLVNWNDFLIGAVNPKSIPVADAPKTYDDFLDPRWKGKMSGSVSLNLWTWHAQPGQWGETKLKDYMAKLVAQQITRDTYPAQLSRLVSGEYPIATSLLYSMIVNAQRKGQPIEPIYLEPARDGRYGLVIPRNAVHPNAAMLLALATVTPEGQAISDKYSASTASWVSDTGAAKFASQHPTVNLDLDYLEKNQVRLTQELEAIARK